MSGLEHVAPTTGSRRVLLEAADARLARRWSSRLRGAGFQVTRCDGVGRGGSGCPLVDGCSCPLVESADVVVHALRGERGQAVLRELRRSGPPVLALTGVHAAPAAQGADSLAAELVPLRLVDEVRRTCASRARLIALPLQLNDGRWVSIRAIDTADGELLRKFDASLSERSRQLRYHGSMPALTAEQAAHWATVDFHDRFALVAVAGDGEHELIIADCRLVPFPDQPGSLEIAIAVADDFQAAGLGRALVQLTLGVAADRGVDVVALVRYDNQRMMRLLLELGFRRTEWELGVVTFVARAQSIVEHVRAVTGQAPAAGPASAGRSALATAPLSGPD